METESAREVTVAVRLNDPHAGLERLDELTAGIREELLGTAVSAVSVVRSNAPEGARAANGAVVGELAVVLGSSAIVLRSVIGVLQAWRERRVARTVEIQAGELQLKLSDATRAEQDRLVQEFVTALRQD